MPEYRIFTIGPDGHFTGVPRPEPLSPPCRFRSVVAQPGMNGFPDERRE